MYSNKEENNLSGFKTSKEQTHFIMLQKCTGASDIKPFSLVVDYKQVNLELNLVNKELYDNCLYFVYERENSVLSEWSSKCFHMWPHKTEAKGYDIDSQPRR